MKRTIVIVLAIAIITSIAVFLSHFFDNKIDINLNLSDKSSVIVVTTPIKDSEVGSPLSVAGRARGSWFFEGSFPIVLLDSYGNIIAESHATAQGEWMTNDFVPFIGDLQFNNYIKRSKGILVLKKDNPGGRSGDNDSVEISILFK